MSRGNRKGGAFERAISVELSLWVSAGKRQDLFWRSSMSGGRATVFKKRGVDMKAQAGDIVAVDPAGHALTGRFFLELKHYKDLQIDSFLVSYTGKLADFWKKACRQADAHDLRPVLIAKQNMRPTLVIMRERNRCSLSSAYPILTAVGLNRGGFDVYLFDEMIASPFRAPVGRRLLNKD